MQVEEAELAAAVQTRRASSAESEVSLLKEQLAEAQKQIKDLSWQIKMAFGSGALGIGRPDGGAGQGGAGGAVSRAAGMLDFLGCGANYRRN